MQERTQAIRYESISKYTGVLYIECFRMTLFQKGTVFPNKNSQNIILIM